MATQYQQPLATERLTRVLTATRSLLWQYHLAAREVVLQIPAQLWGDSPPPERLSLRAALRLVHPHDRHEVLERARSALARQAPYMQHFRVLLGQPSAALWMEHHGGVLCDAEGRVVVVEGVMVDITSHRQAMDALALADRRKDEFLATLAHELRNPLTAIGAAARLLGGVRLDTSTVNSCIDMIRRQAAQMGRLADDLLDLSHVVRDRLALKRERIDLRDCIRTAIEATQESLRARGHQMQLTLPPNRVQLDADPVRLSQLFGNLLTNAIKYTPYGGLIEVLLEREGSWADLRVRDSGIGISAENLPHVFEPFYQAGNSLQHTQGGLGIGLALARRIVLLHGGSIEAHSAGPGRGSEFRVRLRLLSEADAWAFSAADEQAAHPLDHSMHPQRILVADDNTDVAEALALSLRMVGHDVLVAYDGEQALSAAERFKPEVALLDIGMPKRGGHEVAAQLRRRGAAGSRPLFLIALSGWNTRDLESRIDMSVFDSQILKPPDIDAIRRLIESRTDSQPALRSAPSASERSWR